MGFIVGIATIGFMVAGSMYLSANTFSKLKKQEIKKDKAEFGYCCGLEDGVCTFEPKIKKLNQINIAAKEKDF